MQASVSVRKSVRFVLLAAVLAGILFLFASASNVANAKPSGIVNPANGHCYRFVSGSVLWTTALANAANIALNPSPDAACAGMTGYLVVINDAAENAFVNVSVAANANIWLGGSDLATPNTWVWASISGTPTFCQSDGTENLNNCPAQPGWYVNWWSPAGNYQPDNGSGTGVEWVLEMLSNGQWNDTRSINNNPSYMKSYVVEYDATTFAATTTAVTCTPNPSTVGQNVTCTATITESDPATPGGTMAFNDGATPIAGCTSVAVTGNTVQCTTNALTQGSHNITAAYSGNTTFAPSTSSAFVQTVNAAANGRTAAPAEVPEGDTLLLLGGGMSGLGVWLRWQWSRRRARK